VRREHALIDRLPTALRSAARALPVWCIEVALFLLVGGAQLVLDWAVFVLLSYLGLAVAVANVLARLAGATLGFWLNGKVTFRGPDGRLDRRHVARFAVFWCVATLISTGALEFSTRHFGVEVSWMIKPVVEAVLAIASFLISRHWIYR
jgi:putative flippase GtrA